MPKNSNPVISTPDPDWRHCLEAAVAFKVPAAERLTDRDARATRQPGRPAGVLIAVEAASQPLIYFTQRSRALAHHPGQISFPGGRHDNRDTDLAATALRESREEIGLDSRYVSLIGALPRYCTVTGFDITPFVGWVDSAASLEPDGVEVARLFKVPLDYAMNAAHYRVHRRIHDGVEYVIYSIDFNGDHIWGATAGMLIGLAQRVAMVRGESFTLAAAIDSEASSG